MGKSSWPRQLTPQRGFLENYPFVTLLDAGLGWRVHDIELPKLRAHAPEPIRVVHMQDDFARFLTFDVTADTATFTRSIDDDVLIATTSRAAAALGTSDPDVAFTVLLDLPNVCRVENYPRS